MVQEQKSFQELSSGTLSGGQGSVEKAAGREQSHRCLSGWKKAKAGHGDKGLSTREPV